MNKYFLAAIAVCAQGSITASSVPAKALPPILMARYARVQRKLSTAETLNPILRAEAEDAIKMLPKDSEQAKELTDLLRKLEKEGAAAVEQPQPKPIPQSIQPAPVAEAPKEEPKAEAAKVAERTIPIGGRKKESINLDDTESISGETFGEILDRQKEHGDPMIIAQVLTFDPQTGVHDVHYYDAYSFNTWRFGNNYPLSGNLTIVHPNNPNNNLPLQGDVQYFIYDPKKPELGFQHAFSETAFKDNPELRLKIDENQNVDPARKRKRASAARVNGYESQFLKGRKFFCQDHRLVTMMEKIYL